MAIYVIRHCHHYHHHHHHHPYHHRHHYRHHQLEFFGRIIVLLYIHFLSIQ